ncbi:hypothetical protein VSH64_24875 [Amycolatopsis rhabdoformis]|uniref:HK97 gp10 family phage protein n=1 Tax=Amycolatopsis rhabdoformis TaxID=1448059 RepID=A0ABZ1HUS3_9PSEU|nr:hypothetical protein [Amycolatopsis rhabdoformis]WSE26112.1 hypothetical protein VSH64_24875 [Amycolatopsis rhabdoformis]
MAEVDMSQVDALADDLEAVAAKATPKVKKVVEKGANNVKNGMRADASGHASFKHFSRSITYDITHDGLGAEIGPDKDLIQGALGNLIYFGRSDTAGVVDINPPLDKETPRFADALADVAEDIL